MKKALEVLSVLVAIAVCMGGFVATVESEGTIGSETVFNSASTYYISAAFDSSNNKIVIAYRDAGNSNYGTAIIYNLENPPPEITSFAPPSSVNDTVCNWRTFNVTVNQAVNVSWYLNDSLLHTNQSKREANYTLHAEFVGENNVSAVAENANGTDMQTWVWNVTAAPPPEITIDVPTKLSPVYRKGREQFYVNFTYSEEHPKNYTVKVYNTSVVINASSGVYPAGGENKVLNVSFLLNASAADGKYNVSAEMYDNASNYNISYQNESVVKDDTAPTVTINAPAENEYLSSKTIEINVSATDTNLNYTNISIYEQFGCYDNKTEIFTAEGWKLFGDLSGDEKVLTLNPATKEAEWQLPAAFQVYDYNGEMYKITLEDGSSLLVSPEHKVYRKLADSSSGGESGITKN